MISHPFERLRKHISTTTLGTVSEPLPHRRRRAAAYPFCSKCQRGKVNMKVRQRYLASHINLDRLRDHTQAPCQGHATLSKPCPGAREGLAARQPAAAAAARNCGRRGGRRCGSVHGSGGGGGEPSQHDCTKSEPPSSDPPSQLLYPAVLSVLSSNERETPPIVWSL